MRLLQVMYTHFAEPFWTYGHFPLADSNGTRLADPWSETGTNAAPFDQDFYLVLNVAVGGTNGWLRMVEVASRGSIRVRVRRRTFGRQRISGILRGSKVGRWKSRV